MQRKFELLPFHYTYNDYINPYHNNLFLYNYLSIRPLQMYNKVGFKVGIPRIYGIGNKQSNLHFRFGTNQTFGIDANSLALSAMREVVI